MYWNRRRELYPKEYVSSSTQSIHKRYEREQTFYKVSWWQLFSNSVPENAFSINFQKTRTKIKKKDLEGWSDGMERNFFFTRVRNAYSYRKKKLKFKNQLHVRIGGWPWALDNLDCAEWELPHENELKIQSKLKKKTGFFLFNENSHAERLNGSRSRSSNFSISILSVRSWVFFVQNRPRVFWLLIQMHDVDVCLDGT